MRGPWLVAAGHAGRQAANLWDAAAGGVLNAIGHAALDRFHHLRHAGRPKLRFHRQA